MTASAASRGSREKVHVVVGHSESGDDYGPWVFAVRPTEEALEAFLRAECESEFESEGPGVFGSYLHIKRYDREVR